MNDDSQQLKLINQALAAASASIELSRKLLAELLPQALGPRTSPGGFSERRNVFSADSRPQPRPLVPTSASIPAIVGIFDGLNLVTETGQKYLIPENYLSKSMVVF